MNARHANAALLVVLVGFVVYTLAQLSACVDCENRGGAYVRGPFWYECVERKPS